MSHYFQKCAACKKRKFIIKKRTYTIPKTVNQRMTSKDELCRGCYKNISKMLNN